MYPLKLGYSGTELANLAPQKELEPPTFQALTPKRG